MVRLRISLTISISLLRLLIANLYSTPFKDISNDGNIFIQPPSFLHSIIYKTLFNDFDIIIIKVIKHNYLKD